MSYQAFPTGRAVPPQGTDRVLISDGTAARTGDATLSAILGLAPAPVDQTARDAAAAAQTTANGALQRTGGTMTGAIVLAADPTAALGAATKQYVDSKAAGGTAANPTPRVITAAGNVTVAAGDGLIVLNKATGAATTVTLETSPVAGAVHRIKDGKGDAATNNITIVPAAGTIDGAANYVLAVNRGGVTVEYSGTEWVIT